MERTLTHGAFLHCPTAVPRYTLIALSLVLLGACGTVDYDIHAANFFSAPSKNKNIGVVRFHYADDEQPIEVRMRRVKGGYAMQAPLYEDPDGSHIRCVASRTKSLNYYVGLESRLAF